MCDGGGAAVFEKPENKRGRGGEAAEQGGERRGLLQLAGISRKIKT